MHRFVLCGVFATSLLGCQWSADPDADGHKVTAASTYDAKETIVDDALKFELRVPGKDWKLLHAEDISKIVPDATVGALGSGARGAALVVERFSATTLEDAEALLAENLARAVDLTSTESKLGQFEARRATFTMDTNGYKGRFLRVIFLRDGLLYQLMAWGPIRNTTERDLQEFVDAFTPTAGVAELSVREGTAVEEADGTGWRIRDGVFESALSGVRLSPPQGWRFGVGNELRQSDPGAELLLINSALGGYVTLTASPLLHQDAGACFNERWAEVAEGYGEPVATEHRMWNGREEEARRFRWHNLDIEVGMIRLGDVLLERKIWFDAGTRAALEGSVQEVIDRTEFLDPKEHQQLRRTLLSDDNPQASTRVIDGANYVNGVFTSFAHGLRWTAPRGLFSVAVGIEAVPMDEHAVLSVGQPTLGTGMTISVVPGRASSAAEVHREYTGGFEVEPVAATLDGVSGLESRLSFSDPKLPYTQRTLSFPWNEDVVVVSAWIRSTTSEHVAALDRMLDGLSLVGSVPERTTAHGRYTDHLFGFSARAPQGWSQTTPKAKVPTAHQVDWKDGRSVITVLSAPLGAPTANADWLTQLAEQALRDHLTQRGMKGTPERSSVMLDGVEVRQLAYDDFISLGVVHQGVMYLLSAENVERRDRAEFLDGFRWRF